jgi:uncharacterized protein (TIGR00255 family)
MTGYGSAEQDGLRIEVRSVNARYLELKIRQPFGAAQESRLRKRLERSFGRGRVDVSVQYSAPTDGQLAAYGVAPSDFAELGAALSEIAKAAPDLTAPNQLEVLDFLMRRASRSEPATPDETVIDLVIDQAARAAKSMREQEGRHLQQVLAELAAQLRDEVHAIESSLIGEAERLEANLLARFADVLAKADVDVDVDEGRVAQELALLLQKGDVSEELARLESHFGQWSGILAEEPAAGQGKRLDFLTQEFLREVTTIGSKITAHLGSARVIEAKAIVERMREQVQNVE